MHDGLGLATTEVVEGRTMKPIEGSQSVDMLKIYPKALLTSECGPMMLCKAPVRTAEEVARGEAVCLEKMNREFPDRIGSYGQGSNCHHYQDLLVGKDLRCPWPPCPGDPAPTGPQRPSRASFVPFRSPGIAPAAVPGFIAMGALTPLALFAAYWLFFRK